MHIMKSLRESGTDTVALTTQFSMCSIVFSKTLSVYKVLFDYCKQLMSYSCFNNLSINKKTR